MGNILENGQVAENFAKESSVTKKLAQYIQDKGVSLQRMSEATGLPYNALQISLGKSSEGRTRNLRDYEFLTVCQFLEVDPMRFL